MQDEQATIDCAWKLINRETDGVLSWDVYAGAREYKHHRNLHQD